MDCIVLYCIVMYCIVLYCIVLYCIVLIVLYRIVLYWIVLYCIVFFCILLYSIVFYWNIPSSFGSSITQGTLDVVSGAGRLRGRAHFRIEKIADTYNDTYFISLSQASTQAGNTHVPYRCWNMAQAYICDGGSEW